MKFFSRNRFFQKRKKNVSSSKMNSLLNKIDFTEQNELTHVNTTNMMKLEFGPLNFGKKMKKCKFSNFVQLGSKWVLR